VEESISWRTVLSELQCNLSNCPGSIVAYADFGVRGIGQNLRDHDGHDLGDVGVDQGEGSDSDVS